MSSGLSEIACGSQHCVTCGDDGDPMTVVRVDVERGLALCRGEDGASASVEIALVEPVLPGESLLVHAGTAIARLGDTERDGAAA
ncbi:MAG: HypC/HybG/HupF family hydrogenase formation chaperone [Actinomycetota bacterium]|nr:HypC/HybG/HupF family hydrogenase formation chaperone [Actinomycetota bacterium]